MVGYLCDRNIKNKMVIFEKLKENQTPLSSEENSQDNVSIKNDSVELPEASDSNEGNFQATCSNSSTRYQLDSPQTESARTISAPSPPSRPPKPMGISIKSSTVTNPSSPRPLTPLPQASNTTYSEGLYEVIDNGTKSPAQMLSKQLVRTSISSEKCSCKVDKYYLYLGKATCDNLEKDESSQNFVAESNILQPHPSRSQSKNSFKDSCSLFGSTSHLSVRSQLNKKPKLKWKLFELLEKKDVSKIRKYTCALHINPDETVKNIVQASRTCTRQPKRSLPYLVLDRNSLSESGELFNVEQDNFSRNHSTHRDNCLNDSNNIDNTYQFQCLNSNSWLSDTITSELLKNSLDLREAGLLDIREGEKLEVMCTFMEPRLLVRNTIGQYGLVRQSEVRNT
ncbi:hypothetical protein EWB00_005056 [Schistosoma japonicum]|uniref:Uncharacterized protein n=2 Tax=Schistosoma japonicum TaxID=6182 RepID=A0A4Z2D324_SCHJA|nr:hypothetical protein KSF78_0008330 [Schistosoma japonicum]KAH8874321.1 hypothetical protein KSF78_0008330 [Schistosoma japonicum]TNN10839.1 hypothetical protein EWB00_005056 [Schistosoma japonicum]